MPSTVIPRNHCALFIGITVQDMLGKKKLLLRAFWEKVLELKKIKTLGESFVKIETSVAELKIAANFRRSDPYFSHFKNYLFLWWLHQRACNLAQLYPINFLHNPQLLGETPQLLGYLSIYLWKQPSCFSSVFYFHFKKIMFVHLIVPSKAMSTKLLSSFSFLFDLHLFLFILLRKGLLSSFFFWHVHTRVGGGGFELVTFAS